MTQRRKRREIPLSQRPIPETVLAHVRPPVAVVLGSPAEVVHLVGSLSALGGEPICYQMDLYQADRLTEELRQQGMPGQVVTAADLWDLPGDFQTVIYMPARGGERELKIDMVEQAFHILRMRGILVVWSPYDKDPFFPSLLKKVFGRLHDHSDGDNSVFWCQREGDRPRRRHEVTFQARIAGGESCRFVSRPGVFSYGRLDDGARALAEVMDVEPGDSVLDVGCGCGTNGIFAAQRTGPSGHIAMVDSNVRAIALAELNARANGLGSFEAVASSKVEGLARTGFDVALANPPYFAQSSIARLFVERARDLLTPQGRLFLVTRQPNEMAALVEEVFGAVEALERRGYIILCA